MNKRYTHLFFDLDNTLWDFDTNASEAMYLTFMMKNINKKNVDFNTFFEVYSIHNHALWLDYRNQLIGKKELIKERFRRTFEELNITGIDPEETNTVYLDFMSEQNHLKKGVLETLNELKRKKYSMYIITNGFKEVQLKKLENSGLRPFFQKVFISEDIKVAKPGHAIFDYAIKSANALKSKSLMIGDDWDADIVGAANFGIDSVYIDPENIFTQKQVSILSKSKNSTFFINKLKELKLIL
ncbi:MAG: noncanonical pyrimidine nucleotidase, YjjG family [Bacteroidia bacterium]|nr:noncanonical pyrimidine nucleotidase, YjjG family [Bacteroidia bacterium]